MSLLSTRHDDPESAALSVAANRASKCEALRRDARWPGMDSEQLIKIADRYAANLHRDVAEWLSSTVAGTQASESTVAALHEAVARARG